AGVPLAPAGPRDGLVHVVDREDAERARDAGVESHAVDPARRLRADVVVVVGLAPDHGAEARDPGVAAGLRAVARCQRKLERARHGVDVDGLDAGLLEHAPRALHEPVRQVLVEARDDDRDRFVTHAAPAGVRGRAGRAAPVRGPGRAPRGSSPRPGRGPDGGAGARAGRAWPAGTRGWARW